MRVPTDGIQSDRSNLGEGVPWADLSVWSDVVVLAVSSRREALWALGPPFSFNIYPCLPAYSRRKRPPLTENSNTLGLVSTFRAVALGPGYT